MPTDRQPSPRCTEKERYYRGLFEDGEARGASLAQLAVEHDVNLGTLSWWRSEIRRRDALRHGQRVTRKNRRTVDAIEFVPVEVTQEAAPPPATAAGPDRWTFEVVLPGGATVRVPSAFEESALTRVVRAVNEAC